MLRISATGEYALLLAQHLADHPDGSRLADAAESLGIPEPMLRKVANRLVRAGVLESTLGRSGGIRLALMHPSVYDVLAAAGENLSVTTCSHM
ncbi:MAG TPA: Rrf2 family transcriptional regulator [bacterium]|nr:Rrf2 family transcriptional regulator [bacterium]